METQIYSAVGDIITVMLCIICWLLLRSTYTMKQANLKLFYIANSLIGIAAISNSFFHYLLKDINTINVNWLYVLHCVVYICLASVLVLYCMYLCNLFELNHQTTRKLYSMIFPVLILFVLYTIISSIFNIGFYIDENLKVHYDIKLNVFICYYLYLSVIIVTMIYKLKQRLITKTRKCMQAIIISSFLVMFLGYIYGSASFKCISFLFPVIAVLFFFHYNAYDTRTGTLDYKSFDNYIRHVEKPFGIVCLYLKDFHIENNKKLSGSFIKYTEKIFKNYCMFRISDSKVFLVYVKKNNLPGESLMEKIKEDFYPLYLEYKIPYKLVHISSDPRLESGEDYITLNTYINKKIELNSFYSCKEEDIQNHLKIKSVEKFLSSVCDKKDINDDRILVYVQPIYNVRTNSYTNAEVLMRLKMGDEIIMPDVFIPIAENNGYTRTLSKIIINKACSKIQALVKEGYIFDKVSINLSTLDLKDDKLYEEIIEIMKPYKNIKDKISFEITESKDGDYDHINKVINKFADEGITFYLDDFGTSYSNFQRAFTLTIDTIKLDKSLVKLTRKSSKFHLIIKTFVEMLKNAGYKVVFEGIETIDDEIICSDMKVDYLQGFRFSKPVEFDQIRNFFVKYNSRSLIGFTEKKKSVKTNLEKVVDIIRQ